MRNDALRYAQAHYAEALTDLQALLKISSISTLPECRPEIERAAHWLADKLTAIGFDHAAVMATAGHPVVYADWLRAGSAAPTLLIYGHYDVQPVDPLGEWLSPPFEPLIKGDKIYGRGADDDKGQLCTHLAALEAYLKTSGRLPLNVKLLIEGEEEIGSMNLGDFIRQHADLLKADAALISDTYMPTPDQPVIVTGVRGLAYLEVSLRGSTHDLHSGMYGGAVDNPLKAMVRMLDSLHDDQERVTIPGFYDRVLPLSATEREQLNNGLVTASTIMAETGAPDLRGEAGYTAAEWIGARPTLEIHGIKGGFIGEGQKTVIPAVASAKISMRLVPNQQAAEIAELFTQHIQRIAPKTMELAIKKHSSENGALVDTNSAAIAAAGQAFELGFGARPLFMREGGSLPVVTLFMEILKTPVVMMGFGLPDDAIHAPNERFHLPNFYRGIDTAIHYYDIFGTASK